MGHGLLHQALCEALRKQLQAPALHHGLSAECCAAFSLNANKTERVVIVKSIVIDPVHRRVISAANQQHTEHAGDVGDVCFSACGSWLFCLHRLRCLYLHVAIFALEDDECFTQCVHNFAAECFGIFWGWCTKFWRRGVTEARMCRYAKETAKQCNMQSKTEHPNESNLEAMASNLIGMAEWAQKNCF